MEPGGAGREHSGSASGRGCDGAVRSRARAVRPRPRVVRPGASRAERAYPDFMARILLFIVAAAAILAVLWFLLWGFLHMLVIAFWVVLVAVLGFGLYRFGRWSASRS